MAKVSRIYNICINKLFDNKMQIQSLYLIYVLIIFIVNISQL